MAKHPSIHDGLRELSAQWHALSTGLKDIERKGYKDAFMWRTMLENVMRAERAMKKIRTAVRAQATKEKRAMCDHPEDKRRMFSDGSAVCKACGQPFKAPKQH